MGKKGDAIDGVLLLDKPEGMSSNWVLQLSRRLINAQKAGHTGTLDPFATGLLPLAFGNATKYSADLLHADKRYEAVLRFGSCTDTMDKTGEVTAVSDMRPTRESLEALLAEFTGEIEQIPPMYSAIKRDGKNLYDLARRGIEVERHPRKVKVHHLELMEFDGETAKIDVRVSKGTYIRVLADDIGRNLGCFAHLESLRRTEVGDLKIADAIPFAVVDDKVKTVEERRALLKGADFLLQTLGSVRLDAVQTERLRNGQRLPVKDTRHGELLRAYGSSGELLGTVKVDARGTLHPHRLIRFVVTENLEKNGEE